MQNNKKENGETTVLSTGVTFFDAKEKLLLPASYLLGLCYALAFFSSGLTFSILVSLFGLLFVSCTLWYTGARRGEGMIWLACALTALLSAAWGRAYVWGILSFLFAHVAAVYGAYCCADQCCRGGTSAFLPLDFLRAAVIVPFQNLFLRIHLLLAKTVHKARTLVFGLVAGVAGIALLWWACFYLARTDSIFANHLEAVFSRLDGKQVRQVIVRLLLSLPVGAYLFGLLAGNRRAEKVEKSALAARVDTGLSTLRVFPYQAWWTVMGAFITLYACFFALQFTYLFGAFARRLPEGFTVAAYAREGFFELCRVMGINFLLLLLVYRLGCVTKITKYMMTALLGQSILLCVVALSKLGLYIASFGITPLRLASIYLALVLMGGCVAAMYSLWTGKKSVLTWAISSGIAFALLSMI